MQIAVMITIKLVVGGLTKKGDKQAIPLQLAWADTYMVGCGYSYYDDPKVGIYIVC